MSVYVVLFLALQIGLATTRSPGVFAGEIGTATTPRSAQECSLGLGKGLPGRHGASFGVGAPSLLGVSHSRRRVAADTTPGVDVRPVAADTSSYDTRLGLRLGRGVCETWIVNNGRGAARSGSLGGCCWR